MLVKSHQSMNHMNDLVEMLDVLQKYVMKLNPLKCSFEVASDKFLGFMINSSDIEANPKHVQTLKDVIVPKTRREMRNRRKGCCRELIYFENDRQMYIVL